MEKSEIYRIQTLWGTPRGILIDDRSRRIEIAFLIAVIFHAVPFLMLWQKRMTQSLEPVVTLQTVDLIDLQEQEPPPVQKPKSALEFLKMALPQVKKPPPPPPPIALAPPPLIANLSRPAAPVAAADLNLAEVGRKAAPPPMTPSISLDKRRPVAPAALPSISPLADRRSSSAGAPAPLGYGAGGNGRISLTDRPISAPKPVVETSAPKEPKAAAAKMEISRSKVQLSGPLSSRKVLKSAVPQYPGWAHARNIEADVVLRFTVGEDGLVKEGAVVARTSGYPELDQQALLALKEWRFSIAAPGSKDQWGEITFRYLLD